MYLLVWRIPCRCPDSHCCCCTFQRMLLLPYWCSKRSCVPAPLMWMLSLSCWGFNSHNSLPAWTLVCSDSCFPLLGCPCVWPSSPPCSGLDLWPWSLTCMDTPWCLGGSRSCTDILLASGALNSLAMFSGEGLLLPPWALEANVLSLAIPSTPMWTRLHRTTSLLDTPHQTTLLHGCPSYPVWGHTALPHWPSLSSAWSVTPCPGPPSSMEAVMTSVLSAKLWLPTAGSPPVWTLLPPLRFWHYSEPPQLPQPEGVYLALLFLMALRLNF